MAANTVEKTKEEVRELLEDPSLRTIEEELDDHGGHVTMVVKEDDKFWRFTLYWQGDSGYMFFGPTTFLEVEEVEVVVKKWQAVTHED